MLAKSNQIILLDAQAIIDLHTWSLWKRITHGCNIGVTSIIRREARFYKDLQGQKQPIGLKSEVEDGTIKEFEASNEELIFLAKLLNPSFLPSLDAGELEAIAYLYCSKQKNRYFFCSASGLAIKCLGAIGLRHCSISLEQVFEEQRISYNLPPRYSKAFFEKMLVEGFRDSHLYLQKIK